MKPGKTLAFYLTAFGCGFLIAGFGLSLVFGTIGVPAEGPAGIAVAILFGLGLCTLLSALLRRTIRRSEFLKTPIADLSESDRPRYSAESSVWQAKFATYFSTASTFLAFALFFGGISVAFIGFNFASGTNDFGLIMILTGIVVAVIAIVSGIVAVFLGWRAARRTGSFLWFVFALALPAFQAVAYLVGAYLTK